MGQCGCGDFYATHKLAGPAGTVYALDVYPGCESCGTPVAVLVYRFSEDEAKRWHVPSLRDLPFDQLNGKDYDGQHAFIPIWHPKRLVDALWEAIAKPLMKVHAVSKKLARGFPEGPRLERMVKENFKATRAQAKRGGWM